MRIVMKTTTRTVQREEKPSTSPIPFIIIISSPVAFIVSEICILPSSYSGDHGKSGEDGNGGGGDGGEDEGEDDDDDDDDDDEEDETAELFRELEKIKRERAAEKERVEQAEAAVTEAEREAQIATANPLLNLAAALGNAPGINTTAPGTFAVKRRWDDGALQSIDVWANFLST